MLMDELVVVYFQPITIAYVSALTSSRVTPRGIIGWQTGGFFGSEWLQIRPAERWNGTNEQNAGHE